MAYILTKHNNTLDFAFKKKKVKLFQGLFALADVFKARPDQFGSDYMAVIKLIEGIDYFKQPENLEKLALVEKTCIDSSCILILDEGEYSPFVGLDIKVYSEDESGIILFDYEHANTAILVGKYNKEMAKQVGEADVLIGGGAVVAEAREELNPSVIVITHDLKEYERITGTTTIEEQSKVKVHVKPEDKDVSILKVYALK